MVTKEEVLILSAAVAAIAVFTGFIIGLAV